MAGSNDQKLTVALAGTAAIASIISLVRRAATTAQAGNGTFPPEVLDLLRAIAEGMTATLQDLQEIYTAITNLQPNGGGGTINVQGWPPNIDTISSVRKQLLVANIAVLLDDLTVPDGMSLIVKAWPFNPILSYLRVGDSKANAENDDSCYALVPNEFRALNVQNANRLWVSTTALPAWVTISAERKF